MGIPDLVFMPLMPELETELILESPLSLTELVSTGEVCDGDSKPRSTLTAESGLSGSGLPWFTLALFLAALLRNERREFSICEQQTSYRIEALEAQLLQPHGLLSDNFSDLLHVQSIIPVKILPGTDATRFWLRFLFELLVLMAARSIRSQAILRLGPFCWRDDW